MQVVADRDGHRYVLLKRSRESSLVRDPQTGHERYLPTDHLDPVAGASVLTTVASALPPVHEGPLATVATERAMGLLVLLVDRGPISVRDLLGATDLCESDLHGIVGDLQAAGLLSATDVAGERGYRATDRATNAIGELRAEPDD
ncbi:MAG: hypothetical protein R3324_04395 [Halobacteriales archaeon]|nr:hypothetical protein [Halobacteriales archaeon]